MNIKVKIKTNTKIYKLTSSFVPCGLSEHSYTSIFHRRSTAQKYKKTQTNNKQRLQHYLSLQWPWPLTFRPQYRSASLYVTWTILSPILVFFYRI